jgi:hypothetical protein
LPDDPTEDPLVRDAGFISPEERERYQALLLAEMDALEGYSSPPSALVRPSKKGGAAV